MSEEEVDWERLLDLDKKYVIHIYTSEPEWMPLSADEAHGSYFHDTMFGDILDFTSTLWNAGLGHRHPKIVKAIKESADKLCCILPLYVTEHRPELARLIIEDAIGGGWAGKTWFMCSGSEAVERATLIARLYTDRPYIVTRDFAYHGGTMAAAACTKLFHTRAIHASPHEYEAKQAPGYPAEGTVLLAPGAFCYRCPIYHIYPDCKVNGKLACIQRTEDIIRTYGVDRVAAVIAEVVYGFGGNIPPPPEYIPQLRKMTKKLGILWIDDEIICGFGRTGKWFGYQHWDVEPDILTYAKTVTGGHIPLSGVVVSKDIAKMLGARRWYLGATYEAHPLGMAAGRAAVEAIKEEKLVENAAKMGKYLGDKTKRLEDDHKCVGITQGMGLLWDIELVKNKETREPFVKDDRQFLAAGDLSEVPSDIVMTQCLQKGLLIPNFNPNSLPLAPPLNVTEEEIDKAVEILDEVLKDIDKMCE